MYLKKNERFNVCILFFFLKINILLTPQYIVLSLLSNMNKDIHNILILRKYALFSCKQLL